MSKRIAPSVAMTRSKENSNVDRRISVCSECKRGIFPQHEYYWVRGKGLTHKGCDETKEVT
jgi:hypothetical protein